MTSLAADITARVEALEAQVDIPKGNGQSLRAALDLGQAHTQGLDHPRQIDDRADDDLRELVARQRGLLRTLHAITQPLGEVIQLPAETLIHLITVTEQLAAYLARTDRFTHDRTVEPRRPA